MTFDKIRDIIVEQLSVDESMVTMDTNLMKDLEADSLDAVEIIMAIEEEFDIEIPDEEAEKFQLVGDLVKYVDENFEE
ncbi:acyl carrier protein [Aminicella lysinilytica]|uniref:Acyl carrier protein n=1 Tax=Aminicella lysinilytica TaxID=433323 RepID=A0A4R6Q287_9FIRM|nr:acyl carrier protein [Aminicella lysinilytica]TDP55985.1 acyl carrier protein [Aminicella lysinilytica]